MNEPDRENSSPIPRDPLRRGIDLDPKQRWGLIVLAIAGIGVTATGVVAFVLNIVQNNLPWDTQSTIRDHYLAVGDSFSQGFLTGFFLCFFLSLFAVALVSVIDQIRRRRAADRVAEPVPALNQSQP